MRIKESPVFTRGFTAWIVALAIIMFMLGALVEDSAETKGGEQLRNEISTAVYDHAGDKGND